MDRGAWWAKVHRITELDTIEVTKHACAHCKIYTVPWLPTFPFYRHTDKFCLTLMCLQVFYTINNAAMTMLVIKFLFTSFLFP